MTINELKIINDNELIMYISKTNNVLFRDKKKMYEFFDYFHQILINKNKEYEIYINNSKLDSKSYNLINLIDYTAIFNNLEYKKGTILFNYINDYLIKSNETKLEELELYLEDLFKNILNDLNIELESSFNSNLAIIFNNSFDIVIKEKDKLKLLKRLLIELIKNNLDKKYIIFYDNSIIEIDFNDFDNLFCFNIKQNQEIEKYNIILNSTMINFNLEILLDSLKRDWPISYKEKEIYNTLKFYFDYFYYKSEVNGVSQNIAIITKLINKYYNLNQHLRYKTNNKDDIIKSFLLE